MPMRRAERGTKKSHTFAHKHAKRKCWGWWCDRFCASAGGVKAKCLHLCAKGVVFKMGCGGKMGKKRKLSKY
jgi:hypothetical protein